MSMVVFGRTRRSQTGAALVELVVALPVLVLMLVGTADFARALYMSVEMTNAARAGAQYGAHKLALSSNTAGMQATALAAAPNISGMIATATRECQCASDAGIFTALTPSTDCNTAPATSCPGRHRVMTVTVITTATFTTIAGNVGILRTLPLTRTATLRVVD
jgi:Flp pilus assembly protein TadG